MAIEEVQEIYINNIIPSGSGFALNAAGMQVYVPVTVTKFFNLQIGETVNASLIPNKNDKNHSTPYMAVRIIRDQPTEPAPLTNDEDIEARATQLLQADEEAKKIIEVKNEADQYIYNTEKQLQEHSAKIP